MCIPWLTNIILFNCFHITFQEPGYKTPKKNPTAGQICNANTHSIRETAKNTKTLHPTGPTLPSLYKGRRNTLPAS